MNLQQIKYIQGEGKQGRIFIFFSGGGKILIFPKLCIKMALKVRVENFSCPPLENFCPSLIYHFRGEQIFSRVGQLLSLKLSKSSKFHGCTARGGSMEGGNLWVSYRNFCHPPLSKILSCPPWRQDLGGGAGGEFF